MVLKGKNILITGASSGIGMELTKQLAAKGCNLALLNRNTGVTEKLSSELSANRNKIITFKCDVSSREEVLSSISKAKNYLGNIDIAILNSGVSKRFTIENFDAESIRQTINVNFMGIVYCVEALLPDFISREQGTIVGISSLADGRGFPKSGSYCASKAAVTVYLESIRVELKKYSVKVLTVKPGFVKTPMNNKNEFRMPFLIQVEKAAAIILKGIEKEKRIIKFPVSTSIGAKLLKLMPDFLFEMIAERS